MRLFAALDLPEGIRDALAAWQQEALGSIDSVRLVRPEALHLTLAFLGTMDGVGTRGAAEAVRAAARPVEGLRLERTAWLPPRRARVLVVEVADPAGELAALQRRVVTELTARAGHEAERRAFRPHVTVARARTREGLRRPPDPPPPPDDGPFGGAAVVLYRSTPGPGGSRYEALERVGW
jgi:RNA 2',3'-cyclic 3'-phosphodiesterase